MGEYLKQWFEELPDLLRPGSHVLLVDDEEYVRVAVQMALQKHDINVTAVGTGLEALALLGKEVPDVVILDLKMPLMNGPDLLRKIRKRFAFLPVVILTGYPRGVLVEEVLKYPPVTVISKTMEAESVWK